MLVLILKIKSRLIYIKLVFLESLKRTPNTKKKKTKFQALKSEQLSLQKCPKTKYHLQLVFSSNILIVQDPFYTFNTSIKTCFWLLNNLCEFTTIAPKFKRLFCCQKISFKRLFKRFWYSKTKSDLVWRIQLIWF